MKYIVTAISDPFGEMEGQTEYNAPEKAIEMWCKMSKKFPTCVAIQPETNEDGISLLKWAKENFNQVKEWMAEYKCPYKIEYIQKSIDEVLNKERPCIQWKYDQLFPFCYG